MTGGLDIILATVLVLINKGGEVIICNLGFNCLLLTKLSVPVSFPYPDAPCRRLCTWNIGMNAFVTETDVNFNSAVLHYVIMQ